MVRISSSTGRGGGMLFETAAHSNSTSENCSLFRRDFFARCFFPRVVSGVDVGEALLEFESAGLGNPGLAFTFGLAC